MSHQLEDWLTLGVIGFMGGIVSQIVFPTRRGASGFFASATVGVFCGGIAGMAAESFQAHVGTQYLIAAFSGLLGERALTKLFGDISSKYRTYNTFNIGGDQNQVMQGPDMKAEIRSNQVEKPPKDGSNE